MWPCLRTRGGPAAPLLCFCVSLPSAGFLFPMLIFQPFNIKPTTFTFQWPFLKVLLAPKYKSSMSNAIIICIIVCVVLFEHNSWLFLSLSPVYHSCHSEDKCPPCTFLTQKWCMGKHEVSFLSSGSLFRDLWLDFVKRISPIVSQSKYAPKKQRFAIATFFFFFYHWGIVCIK